MFPNVKRLDLTSTGPASSGTLRLARSGTANNRTHILIGGVIVISPPLPPAWFGKDEVDPADFPKHKVKLTSDGQMIFSETTRELKRRGMTVPNPAGIRLSADASDRLTVGLGCPVPLRFASLILELSVTQAIDDVSGWLLIGAEALLYKMKH